MLVRRGVNGSWKDDFDARRTEPAGLEEAGNDTSMLEGCREWSGVWGDRDMVGSWVDGIKGRLLFDLASECG